MEKKKLVPLGKKVGRLMVSMLIISIIAVGGLYVSRFFTLTTGMVEEKCVTGTNLLTARLAETGVTGELGAALEALRGQTGCEFAVFQGSACVSSTAGLAAPELSDSRVSGLRAGESYLGKVKMGGTEYIGSFVATEDSVAFAGIDTASAFRQLKLVIYVVMAVSLLLIVLDVVWLTSFTRKNLSAPLKKLTALAGSMAEGDLGIRSGRRPAADIHTDDEIGFLADVMGGTMGRMADYIGEMDGVLQAIAGGDLTVRVQQEYVGDFVSIRDSLDHILTRLNDTMAQITASAGQVSAGSEQMSQGAQELSQGASEQTAAVQELEEVFETVSARIRNAAESAADARGGAEKMGQDLTEGNRKMKALTAAMGEIKASSDEIEKIIKTIEDIAFQTNILALNASVEASRAGAAGKGFAVVAEEVRNLASKSAEASQSTSALIQRSAKAVEKGTAIAGETARDMADVAAGAEHMVEVIGRVARDAEAQAKAVAEVNGQVGQISMVVQTNSATAEQSAAASEELSNQAELLNTLVGQFRLRDKRRAR